MQHGFAAMHNLVESTRPLQNINKPVHYLPIPTNNSHIHMGILELTVNYTVSKELQTFLYRNAELGVSVFQMEIHTIYNLFTE